MPVLCCKKKMEKKEIGHSCNTLYFSSITLNAFLVNYLCNYMFIILSLPKPDCKFLESKSYVCFSNISSALGTESGIKLEFYEYEMNE